MMKPDCNKIFLLLLYVIFFTACSQNNRKTASITPQKTVTYTIPAPLPISNQDRQRIIHDTQLFYDTTLSQSGFNGGIIVAKGGNIIFEKYKGSINLDGKDSIKENTPLHIASVSKTFTAMAILKLQEEGKVNIDDSLTKYFPNFNYSGVTIKTLLNHRSGLPNYLYFMEKVGWPTDSIMQNKDVLKWLIERKPFIKDIGPVDAKFTYCNTNYAVLALVIEKVTGKPYPEFMKDSVFEPLGLTNTFVHFLGDGRIRSKSFDWKGREIPDSDLDAVYGDKNIYSTPRDLLIWDRSLSDTIFLTQKSLTLAYTPYSNERPGIKNYGLGWRMNIYDDGKKIIFHNGWWHGNNAAFIRVLKDDATIILISNRFVRAVYKAQNLINMFDHYFNTDDEDAENAIPSTIPEVFPVEKKGKIK